MGPPRGLAGEAPPTSALDQLVAASLMLFGIIVLFRRGRSVTNVLKASWPIVLYFSYCLVSLVWSDFPEWGFKRWARALGDLIMVLIVVTDAQPTMALRRLFSRVGFVLLPASVLLIKYYPDLGTAYDAFGLRGITGVTTGKNVLGALCFVIGLGAIWQVLSLLNDKKRPDRRRRLLAQGALVGFVVDLLFTAHCATAGGAFTLGVALMLFASRRFSRHRPAAVHAIVFAMLIGGGLFALLGGWSTMTAAVGRQPDLTGRTEVWKDVLPLVPNSMGGAGFETFWLGPRVEKIYSAVGGPQMTNEAHNGYIEVYLNLGYIGVALIALILGQGYLKAVSAFRRDSSLGGLLVTYVFTALIYNISEAGFRMLSLEWFFLLLSIVSASRAATEARARSPELLTEPASWPRRIAVPF